MNSEASTTPSTAAEIALRLREIGIGAQAEEMTVERRGDRIMAMLPGDRIAWFATTAEAAARLRIEDNVLALVGARCTFRVPTVLTTGPDGWTLRTTVPGVVDPSGFAARLKAEPALVPSVARTLALALAEQHTRIGEADTAGWLPLVPPWPPPLAELEARLRLVVDDFNLSRRIARLLAAGHDLGTRQEDRALVHADFGLHNIVVDPATGAVNGVFDYGSAAWADRHLDFRYLVFAAVPDALLDAATTAYSEVTGVVIDHHRVLVCNALAAIGHLADRVGHGEDELIGGRTLAGDLRWTEWALKRAGFR